MPVLHDLYCKQCGTIRYDQLIANERYPKCCRQAMRVSWERGMAPKTDLYGSEQVSQVLCEPGSTEPLRYTSSRERDAKMKAQGFEPCGDKRGGARNEEHQGLGKVFSYGSAGGSSSAPNRRVT